MQKSRLGESGIDGKLSLEGKLGPFLILSLAVGGQVGAKRGKLTLVGGLRRTKLELKGRLRAPKETPREAKRATVLIGRIAACLIPCAAHVPPCCMGDDESGFARQVSCSNSSEIRK